MFYRSRHWVVILAAVVSCATLLAGRNTVGSDSLALPQTPAVSVSDFLTPDGRFDLDAIRRSGYQGALDLKGVGVRINDKTGEPGVGIAGLKSPADHPDDVYWGNGLSPEFAGTEKEVNALTVYNNLLIVGGSFNVVGGIAVNGIAAWNGSSWSDLGGGLSGGGSAPPWRPVVYDMEVFDGKLIVAPTRAKVRLAPAAVG